jgi:hypothetical protein
MRGLWQPQTGEGKRKPDPHRCSREYPARTPLIDTFCWYPNRTTVVYTPSWLGRRAGTGLVLAGLAAAPIAAIATSALFAEGAHAQQKQEILLVSYAVTKAAYDRIIPKFIAD